MSHDTKTIRQAVHQLRQAMRASAGFLTSIEVWMMVVVAGATVAGFWLAFMGDARSLLAFAFSWGYLAARVVLHVKRILSWPFM